MPYDIKACPLLSSKLIDLIVVVDVNLHNNNHITLNGTHFNVELLVESPVGTHNDIVNCECIYDIAIHSQTN